MSHINAEKTVASQIKSIAGARTSKMMPPMAGQMGMGPMMSEGMGSMMKGGMSPMMGGMSSMMNEGMGAMMKSPGVTSGVASGVVVSAGSRAGKSVIRKVFTHPLVFFGLGVVAGCYLYKYRKSIISASDEAE